MKKLFTLILLALLGMTSAWATDYLAGDFTSWGDNKVAFTDGSVTVSLTQGAHQFKIVYNGSEWRGKGSSDGEYTITRTTNNPLELASNVSPGSNVAITADIAGDYTFTLSNNKVTVTYPATCTAPTIAWNNAPADGAIGGSMTATVTTNQSNPSITWASTDENVATVADGVISYKGGGTTTISAKYTGDGSTYCSDEVSVTQNITVSRDGLCLTSASENIIFFDNSTKNWTTPKCYVWYNNNSKVEPAGKWPGATMTQIGNTNYYYWKPTTTPGDDWYLIINGTESNSTGQSADLKLTNRGVYNGAESKDAGAGTTVSAVCGATTTYSVTYNANYPSGATGTSGSVPTDGTAYSSGASVTVLGNTGNLACDNYTFSKWNTAANGSGTDYAANATFNISANTTLYAVWESSTPATVTLYLHSNNHTQLQVLSTPVPNKEGWYYGGSSINLTDGYTNWHISKYPNSTGETKVLTYGSSNATLNLDTEYQLTENNSGLNNAVNKTGVYVEVNPTTLMLYLTQTAPGTTSYAVNYENGGHGTAPSATTASTVTLSALTETGYINTGWKANVTTIVDGADVAANTLIANGKTVTLKGATTFTAQWTTNTHKLTWTTDGDALTGDYTKGDAIEYGAAITAPATPTKTGYTFAGWSDGSSVVTPATTMPDNDLAYTATWTANTNTAYTVKHYQQNLDGTYPTEATETENLTGTTAASVTPAVKSYTGFTAPATQTATIAADGSLVITYNYTRNTHKLAWEFDGGSTTSAESEYTHGDAIKYGATITKPADPTKTGYTFNNYNATIAETMPDGDVTYTAQWNEIMSTITVSSANTEQGTVDASTASVGIATTQTLTATAKTGYKFKTWTLEGCSLSSGALTDASITIIGLGAGATGTAVASFEEDLSSDWQINFSLDGNFNLYDFTKKSGASTSSIAYYTFDLAAGKTYNFELKKVSTGLYYENSSTMTYKNCTNWEFKQDATSRQAWITSTVAGKYEFKVDYSGTNPKLSVTYPNFYTVTFKNGDANFAEQYVVPGETLGSFPTDPTKEGYTFLGWYDAATGGNAVAATYVPTAATTLYAHFAKIEVASKVGETAKTQVLRETVTIVPTATGLAAETPEYTYSCKYGGKAVAMYGNTLDISEAGTYVFTVTATENDVTVSSTCTVTCVIPGHLVYATSEGDWKAIVAVETESENVVKATVDGSVLRRRTEDGFVGRSYFGFSTSSSATGSNADCFGSTTSADAEVTVDGEALASKYQSAKALYITLDADTKANYDYTFHFNITNGEVSVTSAKKSYKVTYNADGGTCNTPSVDVEAGESTTLPMATKLVDGSTTVFQVFDGWYDGDTKVGAAGDSYTPTGAITLTAHYSAILAELIQPGDRILILTGTEAKAGWFWGGTGDKSHRMTKYGTCYSKTLSYYYNGTDSYTSYIALSTDTVTEGLTKFGKWDKIAYADNSYDVTKNDQITEYADKILYYSYSATDGKFKEFTHLSVTASPSFSETGTVKTGTSITISPNKTAASGTLYDSSKDDLVYTYYIKNGNQQLQVEPTFMANNEGTWTLVAFASDPYGYETVKLTDDANPITITVTDPSKKAHDVTFTVAGGGSVTVDGAAVENGGSASISEVQASTLVASSATHYFNGWTLGSGVTLVSGALTDKTITVETNTVESAVYTVSASFVAYDPVASISVSPTYVVPGSSTEVTLTPATDEHSTWPADMTYVWELYKGDTKLSTTDNYFTITDGAETAKLAAAKVAALEAGVYTFKLKVYAGDQCSENQLGETKTCTFSVATPYYVYQGQNYSLPEGYTYKIAETGNVPAYYAYNNGTLQYENKNTITDRVFKANTMGMYIVERTTDGTYTDQAPAVIFVYRYYAKFPWGYCPEEGKALDVDNNRAWKWEALAYENSVFTVTGLYSSSSSDKANIAWDYYYDWQGVYRYDGNSNSNTHPGYAEGKTANAGVWQQTYDAVTGKMTTNDNAKDHGSSNYIAVNIDESNKPDCGDWFKMDYTTTTPVNGTTQPNVLSGGKYAAAETTDPYTISLTYGPCTNYNHGVVSHDQPGDMVKDGTTVTFNAAAETGYFCTGWYSDAACTTPIVESDDVHVDNNTLIATVHSNFSAYAKFVYYRMLYANFEGEWKNYVMDEIQSGEYQVKVKLTAGTYSLKVRNGSSSADDLYGFTTDNSVIYRKNNSEYDKTLTQKAAYNVQVCADIDSIYTFTWKDNGNKLAVTFPTGNLLYVWEGTSSGTQVAKKNFYTTNSKGEVIVNITSTGIYRFKMQNYESSNDPDNVNSWFGMDGKNTESSAIQHSVYNYKMYSNKTDVCFNATEVGDYHFQLEWKTDNGNSYPYISVVYPSDAVDYDYTKVLEGTHKVILVGLPQNWSQTHYDLYDSEGNVVYTTPVSSLKTITVSDVTYHVAAIPVAVDSLEGGTNATAFYHGHTKDLGLSHTVTTGGIYIVTNKLTTVPSEFTELASSTTDGLYFYVPSDYTAHSEVTSSVNTATTLGVSIAQTTSCSTLGKSVLSQANRFSYFVKDEVGNWQSVDVKSGKLDVTDQEAYPVYRGYQLATLLYDGYIYELATNNQYFDVVDIKMTDDKNQTFCYTTYYNSKKAVKVPEGLKAFTIVYHEDKGTVSRNHTFNEGDVVPAGTAVVFRGSYTFMQSKQVDDNERSAGNRILEEGTDATAYTNSLVGTDESGKKVSELGTNVVKAYKFSLASGAPAGSMGWYWGNSTGTGDFEAWPHKAYLVLPSASAPVRFVMSDILDAIDTTPTDLEDVNAQGQNDDLKFFQDGKLFIRHNGVLYDAAGRMVK